MHSSSPLAGEDRGEGGILPPSPLSPPIKGGVKINNPIFNAPIHTTLVVGHWTLVAVSTPQGAINSQSNTFALAQAALSATVSLTKVKSSFSTRALAI